MIRENGFMKRNMSGNEDFSRGEIKKNITFITRLIA